jgi:hypothetical protein
VLWWSARGARGSIQRATLWGAKWSPGMTRNDAKNRSRAVEKIVPEGHKKVGPKGAKKVDQKVHKKVYQKVPKKVNREDRRGPSEWLPGASAVVWKSHYEWPSGRSQSSIGRVIKSRSEGRQKSRSEGRQKSRPEGRQKSRPKVDKKVARKVRN